MQIEFVLLILSILFFASILAGKAGSRFGVPALLLFLGVGMLFGSDGPSQDFDIDFPEEIKSAITEATVTEKMLTIGTRMMDFRLPEKTLVIMVKRGDNYFVPTGKTLLHVGDRLMLLSDNQAELECALEALGI